MSMVGRVGGSPFRMPPRNRGRSSWVAVGLTVSLVLAAVAIHLAMGDQPATAGAPRNAGAQNADDCHALTIDFAGLPAGTILGEQYADQGVHITAVANGDFPDALIVFDSNSTDSRLDDDLRVGVGNIAILANNLTDANGDTLVDLPDENNFGGRVTFTFDSPVSIGSFLFIDHDHQPSDYAAAYNAAGNELAKVFIPVAGDGSVQTIEINADGVSRFELVYRDSAGFTGIEVECPPEETPTPTPPEETPTPTPPEETPTPTPPEETPTPTPPEETPTPTPPEETPTPTPPEETPTPTPSASPTPTSSPSPSASPTPLGATATPARTPSPSPTPSPTGQAVEEIVSGPTVVPTAGVGSHGAGATVAKLLVTFGMLIAVAGLIVIVDAPRRRA